jgi:diaminopimelate epimerase
MKLPFTKMHDLGNDFVVMDARAAVAPPIHDWPALARAMCERHCGVGADQLLLVCDSTRADVMMRLFNTDGFEAEMCGNGVRCIGKYVYERGIVRKPNFSLETLGGIKQLQLHIANEVVMGATVAMGVPRIIFERESIEVGTNGHHAQLTLMGVDMGNPHAVAFIDMPVNEFPLEQLGTLVEHHPLFPNRTNFEIVNVESPTSLRVRVWERSAGITLACGTGACAVTAAARLCGFVGDETQIHLPGGTLTIAWDGEGDSMMMGPATTVFEGVWVV